MRLQILTSMVALAIPTPAAFATSTTDKVLAANREAMAPLPATGSLHAVYRVTVDGVEGKAVHDVDLASGAFIEAFDVAPQSGAKGFDGQTPWQTDISHASTDQEGGDRIVVAVNEAYRQANAWWRMDHGGAQIVYVGREDVNGAVVDHLSVTPAGGRQFEAYFNVANHLLMRTSELQQASSTTTDFGDYRPEHGVIIAHTQTTDFWNGGETASSLQLVLMAISKSKPKSAFTKPRLEPAGGYIVGGRGLSTIPFQLLNNHIYVQAKVNGVGPFNFIVDTGGVTLLSPRVVKFAALKPEGQSMISGAGETSEANSFARFREISVGGVRLRDQTASIFQGPDKDIEGLQVDGMLGFEFFRRFSVTIDYGTHIITVRESKAQIPRSSGVPIPFVFYDHLPQVLGSIDDIPARLDLDTGSRAEINLTSPTVRRLRLRERYKPGINAIVGWGVGGALRSYVVRIPSLTIGTITSTDILAALPDAKRGGISDPNFEGNVGSGFLKRYAVTFDYRRKTVWLRAIEPRPIDSGKYDRSGMWINASQEGFVIVSVTDGSAAAEAGLKADDVILSIDGKPAKAEVLAAVRRELITLPKGTTLMLSVQRGDRKRSVSLVLKDQI